MLVGKLSQELKGPTKKLVTLLQSVTIQQCYDVG